MLEKEKKKLSATHSLPAVPSSIPSVSGHKRLPSLDASSLRVREGDRSRPPPRLPQSPKTPDQPTHPTDPSFSGTSNESKDEEYTKVLVSHFLGDTMSVLRSGFTRITWQQSGNRVQLCQTFDLCATIPNVQGEGQDRSQARR